MAVLLGGCLGGGSNADPQQTQAEPEIVGPALVSDRQGGIEGTVIDASLLPVPNVLVHLRESSGDAPAFKNTTSGVDGRFIFELVDPGTYRVTSSAAGFGNVTQLVVVVVGEATAVRLVLAELASDEPYVSLLILNGIFNCGVAAVVVSAVCVPTVTSAVLGTHKTALFFPIPVGHQAVVAETDWQNREQVMRNWYMNDEKDDNVYDGDCLGDAIGGPVLRKDFTPDTTGTSYSTLCPDVTPFPPSSQNFTLLVATFYDGAYQREIDSTARPACDANPVVGYCTGVGVILEMKYTQYVTIFVNQRPEPLEAYSAVPDY
ncbi:MAG TPA: carboxypeptidase-like regulatory domain-containing protein [Candidatus Thermoplasmatota archaeon]